MQKRKSTMSPLIKVLTAIAGVLVVILICLCIATVFLISGDNEDAAPTQTASPTQATQAETTQPETTQPETTAETEPATTAPSETTEPPTEAPTSPPVAAQDPPSQQVSTMVQIPPATTPPAQNTPSAGTTSPAQPSGSVGNSSGAVAGEDPFFTNGYDTAPGTNTADHTHAYSTQNYPPSCTVKGYDYHECSCGHYYLDNFVSALDHDFEANFTSPPSPTHSGYTEYLCNRCGTTENRDLTDPTGIIYDVNAIIADGQSYAAGLGFTLGSTDGGSAYDASLPWYSVDSQDYVCRRLRGLIDQAYGQAAASPAGVSGYVMSIYVSFGGYPDTYYLQVTIG